jgi:transposase
MMMTFYAALDVSLRSVAICIVDGEGTVCLERTVPSEVSEIAACLRGFDHGIEVVGFEAGTLSQLLAHGLSAEGFEVVCLETRQVKAALSAMRNKTDRTDARGIAQILRTGWYAGVHVKSWDSHYTRALLSSRKALQKKAIDLENEIRGLLKVFGIKLPASLGHGPFDGRVRPLIETDRALADALLPLLEARGVLYDAYLELHRRVRRAAFADAVCRRLMTVPGVGPITALTFKAAVDDPRRFTRSRTVGAHFCLTPRRHQSGEHDNPGRISKAGDAEVRTVLYAAANALLSRPQRWSSLKAWGMRLQKTRGRQKALVALARKLAVIMHRMWLDGSDFQWGKEVAAR